MRDAESSSLPPLFSPGGEVFFAPETLVAGVIPALQSHEMHGSGYNSIGRHCTRKAYDSGRAQDVGSLTFVRRQGRRGGRSKHDAVGLCWQFWKEYRRSLAVVVMPGLTGSCCVLGRRRGLVSMSGQIRRRCRHRVLGGRRSTWGHEGTWEQSPIAS